MLPYFIQEHLIHSSDFHMSRKYRTTLALLRNLQFYEVHNRQVLDFIDLQSTILNKVQNKLEISVTGLNGTQNNSDILGTSFASPGYTVGGIIFGKYIHQSRGDKKVYILIKCFDQMIVIKKDTQGLALQAEYEEVQSFKMCKGKDYQERLAISFLHNKEDIITNFQDVDLSRSDLPKSDAYIKMLDTIKMKQSELLVHKSITKKEFAKLKSTELFGSNYLRTPELEEMQILLKCGNAWFKVTAADDIIVGVPLVNNSSTRLIVLRNMRAVVHGCGHLNYTYSLYQLSKRLDNMDTIESFFRIQDDDDDNNSYTWSQCTDFSLRPEAFCVLVLRFKVNEYLQFNNTQIPLFAFYDIVMPRKTFSQKCFLTTLSFQDIFTNESCRINFHENHLHRDLLAVISASYQTEVRLEYNTNGATFEDYLCTKMGFVRVPRPQTCEIMQIDGKYESSDVQPEKGYFYNKNPDHQWHGTLIAISHITDSCRDIKLYTKTAEKSKVFLRQLDVELNMKCGIKATRLDTQDLSAKLVGFETALRDELQSSLEFRSNSTEIKGVFDTKKKQTSRRELDLNELKTDFLFKDLLS